MKYEWRDSEDSSMLAMCNNKLFVILRKPGGGRIHYNVHTSLAIPMAKLGGSSTDTFEIAKDFALCESVTGVKNAFNMTKDEAKTEAIKAAITWYELLHKSAAIAQSVLSELN